MDDVLAPVFLWPVTISVTGKGLGKIEIRSSEESPEPIFNEALVFWIQNRLNVTIETPNDNISEPSAESFLKTIQDVFTQLQVLPLDSSSGFQGLPGKKELRKLNQPRVLLNEALLGVVQWHNRELMEDLKNLFDISSQPEGLSQTLVENFLSGKRFPPVQVSPPPESDRYLVRMTDYTQEEAIWQARSEPGVIIPGPPGTGKSQTIVNIVADALARGRRILVLCQKKAARDVVAERLSADRLADFFVLVNDPETDRRQVISKISDCLNAGLARVSGGKEDFRILSGQIESLEKELDDYYAALFDVNDTLGLSYREIITTWRCLYGDNVKPLEQLFPLVRKINFNQLKSVEQNVRRAAECWSKCDPLTNPWQFIKDGLDIDDLAKIEEITNTLENLKKWDEKHRQYINKHGAGMPIEGKLEHFIDRGEAQRSFIKENEHQLKEVYAWARRLHSCEPKELERSIENLKQAIELSERRLSLEFHRGLDLCLNDCTPEELKRYGEITGYLTRYKRAWRPSLHSKYRRFKEELIPLLNRIGNDFSFELAEKIKVYCDRKLLDYDLRVMFQSLFRNDSEEVFSCPDSELPKLLAHKVDALKISQWFIQNEEPSSWPAKAWEAATRGDFGEFKSVLSSFNIAVHRAKLVVAAILEKLNQLRPWLRDEYVSELEQKVISGELIQNDLLALTTGLQPAKDIVFLKLELQRSDEKAKEAVGILERLYRDQIKAPGNETTYDPSRWGDLCLATAYHEWAVQIEANSEPLQKFNQSWYEHTKGKLREKLDKKRNSVIPFIKAQWLSKQEQASQQNWGPILALSGRSSKRLREIIEMGRPMGLFDLIPCWITDPNSASRLFPLEPKLFDVVIFDEASQCPVEQAIPAIYRGSSIVVAGDEKQLPPTSFLQSAFDMDTMEISHRNRMIKAEKLPDEEAFDKEMQTWSEELAREVEDLLTASTDILPDKFLDIHYRSRFPELIKFSNNAFYGGRLQAPTNVLTCEGQITKPIVLYQTKGQYEKQCNGQEALKIVAVLEELFQWDADPPTIGVVTFSQPQAELIDLLLDRQAEISPDFGARLDWQRQRKKGEQDEGLFVKNLENVQGDERDIIILSTTFGNGPDGVFRRYFGPLNTMQDGPRRLNVAISRARLQEIVVTSLPIDQISPSQSIDSVPGVVHGGKEFLHLYMKYVRAVDLSSSEEQRQILKLARELGKGPDGDEGMDAPESAFEDDVRGRLSRRFQKTGLQHLAVESQVGCSGFRIDLAVRDPESGRYILGIECDGRSYHSNASARFIDIWKQDILEKFRWKIYRVWSQNWWKDPAREIDEIVNKVKSLTRS